MKFEIIRDYYNEKEYIYNKKNIELEEGLTVLVGCNGSGKSTLLRQIKDLCKKQDIPCYYFDNLTEGGSNAREKAGFYGDTMFLAQSLCSSEGENINLNICNSASKIGNFVNKNEKTDKIFILMDAVDSGLSIDYVIELKELLFKTILSDTLRKGIETYIVVSANEYEMARNEKCFLIPDMRYKTFENYDEYRNFIIESRNKKNKRYNHEPFEFR